MKKKLLIIFFAIVSLLLINDIIFLRVNKDVNYKELKKDLISIKKRNKIKYAKKNPDNKKRYDGNGYYIIRSKGSIRTHYSIYIKKKLIWNYNKIKAR